MSGIHRMFGKFTCPTCEHEYFVPPGELIFAAQCGHCDRPFMTPDPTTIRAAFRINEANEWEEVFTA